MARAKKDARILNIKLATPVYDRLSQFCEESGLSKTVATERILAQYFDVYFKKPEDKRNVFSVSKE